MIDGRFWDAGPSGATCRKAVEYGNHRMMKVLVAKSRIQRRMIDTLYVDAMLLADEARGYFDENGRRERDMLSPAARVSFSCESLKITTRLMHIIAWLLTQRAVDAGELRPRDALDPSRRLGPAPVSNPAAVLAMPLQAQGLIAASRALYRRVVLLDESQAQIDIPPCPVQSMHDRLAMAF